MKKEELLKQNKKLVEQNKLLLQELAELKKLIFGSKRERFIPDVPSDQLGLFSQDKEEEEVDPVIEKERISYERTKKKHTGRQALPEHLPVEEIIIEPQGDLTDTKVIGQDVTETLKYTPASLVKIRTIRPRRVKAYDNGHQTIIQAELPVRSFPKIIAENSLLAHIIVSKFIDHLPFYRQIQRFKRDYDWTLSKSTVNDWFIAVCTLLEPLYQTMIDKLLQSEYIQADESHIKVQDSDKKGTTHQGYQWVYRSPQSGIVIFHYRKGRGVHGPKEFLKGYEGYLQSDGYKVYDKIGQNPKITLVGCHVHARRYFIKAKEAGDKRAERVLQWYQQIYQLEKKGKDLNVQERKQHRDVHIKPILEQMKLWLDKNYPIELPKSPLGKAIQYSLHQWPKLIKVLDDGPLELDNNLIENKIRPLALGRKNYLFAGSHAAAQRIAIMYSFFATCKSNNVNPYSWLNNTLEVISEYNIQNLEELIPRGSMQK